jgi:Na+/H+-dicarboxylate symporter
MDRCRTVTNVTGDCVVAGIVAARCDIGEEEIPDIAKDISGSSGSDTEDKVASVDQEAA